MSRSFLFCALLTAPLFAQATSPSISVYNAASHYAIAPGSFAAVNVGAIGNVTPDLTVDLTTSDGAKARLNTIAPPTAPGMVNTTEVWVVIPQNAPLGAAVFTATMGGVAYTKNANIVATAPGIFTAAYNGIGPALALNYPSTPNALTSAAVPNGIVTLFATGLNGVTAANVIVEVGIPGSQPVIPLYAGPQGQPGLDQINFVIPANTPIGCYIPVSVVVIQGPFSNQTTLSINQDPYACAHPLGLSYSQLKTLDAGGTINLARLVVAAADNSGANQPSMESASLNFSLAFARDVAAASGVQGVPLQQQISRQATCIVASTLTGGSAGPGSRTDGFSAGTVLLAGPGGKQLQLNQNGYYGAQAPADQLPFFTGGNWSLSATGDTDIGAFTQNIPLRPRLKFTNLDANTILPSDNLHTLRWDPSGFSAGDTLIVSFAADTSLTTCSVPAQAGELMIPGSALAFLKGKTAMVSSTVQSIPGARPVFTIPYTHGEPIRGLADYYFTQRIAVQVQ